MHRALPQDKKEKRHRKIEIIYKNNNNSNNNNIPPKKYIIIIIIILLMIIINNLLKKSVLISEFQNNVDQENVFVNIFWYTSSFIKLLHKKFNNEKIIIVTVISFTWTICLH